MKDAKGHGSNSRSEHVIDAVYSSKAGVGGLGKGMYARTHSGDQYKLNPAATGGMIPHVNTELDPSQHTRVIAAQHGIQTGHLDSSPVSSTIHSTIRNSNMRQFNGGHFAGGLGKFKS